MDDHSPPASDASQGIPDAILQRERELAELRAQHRPVFGDFPPAKPVATSDQRVEAPMDRSVAALLAKLRPKSDEEIAEYERRIAESRDREERELRAAAIRDLLESGIRILPSIAQAIADNTLHETPPLVSMRRYADQKERRVWVGLGDPGVGKTVAAAWALWRFRHLGTMYVTEPQLARWSSSSRFDRDRERCENARMLVIDELGTAPPRDLEAARVAVFDAVDRRIGKGRLILIGNLSGDAFAKRYGARMIDRLRQVGGIKHFTGESLRK